MRRGLAAGARLLALHLPLTTARAESVRALPPTTPAGATLTLPLAAPGDHLAAGDEVSVHLPGQEDPLVTGATVLGAATHASGGSVVRITIDEAELGPVLRELAPERGGSTGFVVVATT